jgi:molecular chaperone GrpE
MTSAPREGRDAGADPAADDAEVLEDAEVIEDAEIVEEQGSDPADDASERVAEDLDELGELARERDEYLELAQRARADFENFRKRAAGEAAEAERRGKVSLAKELVPALDNLERALKVAGIDPEQPQAADGGDPPSREVSGAEAFARGVQLVLSDLRAALTRAGVESYDPAGERFDPNLHEALSTTPAEGAESGVVVETVERGYRLDGLVIRAARVVVAE